MASIEEILGKKINTVKELKEEIKRLQDSLINLDSQSEEYKSTVQQLTAAQGVLNNVTKASVQDNNAAKDSIVGMQKEYKSLYDTYKMLSEEQRNSPMGREMAKSLDELSSKLNESKKEVGSFKDNIGRYAESASEAFQKMGVSMGAADKPLKLLNNGMKGLNATLKANPILAVVAAVTALIAIFKKGLSAINQNEESQMRLNKAMATFQPIIDAVKNSFDRLGQAVLIIIEGVAKFVDKLRDAGAAIKDFFNGNKEATKQLQEQRAVYNDLAEAQNKLTKIKREAEVQASKKSAEVERLREEASETTNLTEKKRLLEEAKRIQGEIDQQNIEIAQEELRIMQIQDELTVNSTEDNEKLAAALQNVANAEARAAQNARQFNKQLNGVKSSSSSAGRSVEDFRKKAKDLYKQLQDDNKTEIVKIKEKYEEEKKLLEKYHLDTTLLTKKYNKDMANAQLESRKNYLDNLKRQATIDNQAFAQLTNDYLMLVQATRRENPVASLKSELALAKDTIKEFEELKRRATEIESEILNTFDESAYGGSWDKIDEEIISIINQPKEKLTGPFLDLRNLLDDVNERYGTSIGSVTALRAKIAELQTGINDIKLDTVAEEFNETLADIQSEIQEYLDDIKQGPVDVFNLITALDDDWKNDLQTYSNFLDVNVAQEFDVLQEKASALSTALESIYNNPELLSDANGIAQYNEYVSEYYDTMSRMIEKVANLAELAADRTKNLWDASYEAFGNVTNSINTVISSYSSLIQAEINEGRLNEKETKKKIETLKKYEKLQLAVSIANIVASTAAAIQDVWRGYAGELVVNSNAAAAAGAAGVAMKPTLDAKSLAAAILRTAGIAATGAAQITAASNGTIANLRSLDSQLSSSSAGGAGASVTALPSVIDSTPYTYTRTLQTTEEEQEMNRPIWVSVTDIEDGLGRMATVTDEASF